MTGERIAHPDDEGARELYDRLLQHTHGWTERELYVDNGSEVIEDLRWAMYATLLTETATMHLESQVEELDHADQLEAAPNNTLEAALRKTWRAQARLKLRGLFDMRRKTRAGLLLPEKADRG